MRIYLAALEAYRLANPEGIESLLVTPPRRGPGVGQAVAIRIHAKQYDVAKQLAEEAKATLRSLPGVYRVSIRRWLNMVHSRCRTVRHRT